MSLITINCENIEKSFTKGKEKIEVLKQVNFQTYENQMVMLMGPSGSGKSTILSIIAGLISQDSGQCLVLGKSINTLPEREKTKFRGKNIGFMFQNVKLIPTITVAQNTAIPLLLQNVPEKTAYDKVADLLSSFGLARDLDSFPSTLSGGEQQRVSIARACIHKPKIILCDEPTSFLDSERGAQIMHLLKKIQEEEKATIVIVTHDARILSYADKIFTIEDGVIKEVVSNKE